MHTPAYITTGSEALRAKAALANEALRCCTLCPRNCRVDRTSDARGYCRTGESAIVASYNAHFGEEAPLVGSHGSGTLFFSYCNLRCNFCQNFDISHEGEGWEVDTRRFADMMLDLQKRGCHNINLVTPSHIVAQFLNALIVAAEDGLRLPVVYNSSAYDQVDTLRLLEGVVDIYMPDFKFWDSTVAEQTCQAADYVEIAMAAITEMHRQVGDLMVDDDGLAQRGLLLRHLVLPEGQAGTRDVMRFIAKRISPDTYVNIMPQYRPYGRAAEMPQLARAVTQREFEQALLEAGQEGITRLDRRGRVFVIR